MEAAGGESAVEWSSELWILMVCLSLAQIIRKGATLILECHSVGILFQSCTVRLRLRRERSVERSSKSVLDYKQDACSMTFFIFEEINKH